MSYVLDVFRNHVENKFFAGARHSVLGVDYVLGVGETMLGEWRLRSYPACKPILFDSVGEAEEFIDEFIAWGALRNVRYTKRVSIDIS